MWFGACTCVCGCPQVCTYGLGLGFGLGYHRILFEVCGCVSTWTWALVWAWGSARVYRNTGFLAAAAAGVTPPTRPAIMVSGAQGGLGEPPGLSAAGAKNLGVLIVSQEILTILATHILVIWQLNLGYSMTCRLSQKLGCTFRRGCAGPSSPHSSR